MPCASSHHAIYKSRNYLSLIDSFLYVVFLFCNLQK